MKPFLTFRLWLLISVLVFSCYSCTTVMQITPAHYGRAEALLASNIRKNVYHLEVQPNWLDDSTGFWHVTQTREGKRFFLTRLDPSKHKTGIRS
jgi:dipeptidyl-peptidase 4